MDLLAPISADFYWGMIAAMAVCALHQWLARGAVARGRRRAPILAPVIAVVVCMLGAGAGGDHVALALLALAMLAGVMTGTERSERVCERMTEALAENRERFEAALAERARHIEDQTVRGLASARIATVAEMAGGVAHEINNPLAIVQGHSENLLTLLDADRIDLGQARHCAARIHAAGCRIESIVGSLLTFAHGSQTDEVKPNDLSTIVAHTVDLCSGLVRHHGIKMNVVVPRDLTVECNGGELTQVLYTLLVNAVDAVEEVDDKWILIEAKANHERLKVVVTDSGPGVDDAHQEKLFTPFFTTKGLGEGAGLGLCSARGIVEAHQGTIYLDIFHPHTRFVIDLPRRGAARPLPVAS